MYTHLKFSVSNSKPLVENVPLISRLCTSTHASILMKGVICTLELLSVVSQYLSDKLIPEFLITEQLTELTTGFMPFWYKASFINLF